MTPQQLWNPPDKWAIWTRADRHEIGRWLDTVRISPGTILRLGDGMYMHNLRMAMRMLQQVADRIAGSDSP